jgi:hypothetical protein
MTMTPEEINDIREGKLINYKLLSTDYLANKLIEIEDELAKQKTYSHDRINNLQSIVYDEQRLFRNFKEEAVTVIMDSDALDDGEKVELLEQLGLEPPVRSYTISFTVEIGHTVNIDDVESSMIDAVYGCQDDDIDIDHYDTSEA